MPIFFFDEAGSNPSILKIASLLDNQEVIRSLKEKYISELIPDNEDLRAWYDDRRNERAKEFDEYHSKLVKYIEILEKDEELKSCKAIRDKFTAHLDLQYSGGNYSYPDISGYAIKWNTPKRLLKEMRPIIISIGCVVRSAGFAWETFDSQNNKMATGLWRKGD